MKSGNSGVAGLFYFSGSPLNASVSILNPEKGALVIDYTNAALYQKTSVSGDNSGYDLIFDAGGSLGAITVTSINKVVVTAPATSATLTLSDGSSLITVGGDSITFTSTAATDVTLPTTGTLATLAGSEALTGKTVNGLTITTTTGTLTLVNGSSIITAGANAVTLTSTGATNVTLPTTGTLATIAGSEALTGKTVNGLTVTTTTGTLTIAAAKVLTASNTLTFAGTDSSTLNIGTGGTLGTAAYTAAADYQPVAANLTNLAGVTPIADGVVNTAVTPNLTFSKGLLVSAAA